MTFNVQQARAQLSKLIARAEAGEEIVLARDGKPAVKLVPLKSDDLPLREPGAWKGRIWISDSFDEEAPEFFSGDLL
jgi:prevent-host-death family protein